VDSTVDDKANKTEDGAGDRAANKAIDNDTTCTAEEKEKLKALAKKIGWKKQRAGGVFTHFGGAASGNAHMLWGLACRTYKAAKTAFSDKKKARTQEERSAKEGGDLKLADEAFNELKGKNFSEAAVLGLKTPALMALARHKLHREAEVAKIKKEKGKKQMPLFALVWPDVQLWAQAAQAGAAVAAEGGERGAD
jgi:hypothetical protein